MKGNSGASITIAGGSVIKRVAGGDTAVAKCFGSFIMQSEARLPERMATPPSASWVGDGFSMAEIVGKHPFDAPEDWVLEALLGYVRSNLEASWDCYFGGEVFLEKLAKIEGSDKRRQFKSLVDNCKDELRAGAFLPVGRYHGDLTLCNMLHTGGKLFVYDFTPQIAPSPIFDIVKLRQDTNLGWYLAMGAGNENASKIKEWDERIKRELLSVGSCRDAYKSIQKLNILRIAPYAKSKQVIRFIRDSYEQIHNTDSDLRW